MGSYKVMEIVIFVLYGVDVFCCTDLFIDWGNPSNNLSDYINGFGEIQLPVISRTSSQALVTHLFSC